MNTQDVHGLAAYALDALEPEDRTAFERHLEGCAECRAALPALEDAAASLAFAVGGPAPPPALRDRILVQARGERPNVVPLRRRRRLLPALVAAAACVAVGLGVWVALLSGDLDSERQARDDEARALAVLTDPTARVRRVRGGVLAVRRDGEAVLAAELAPPPEGRRYMAWVIRGAAPPEPAGGADARVGERTIFALDEPVPAGATVAVTAERSLDVDAPSESPRLAVRVA